MMACLHQGSFLAGHFKIMVDHHLHQFDKAGLWLPTEHLARFAGVSLKAIHLGRA
jgi:hypothetical protein